MWVKDQDTYNPLFERLHLIIRKIKSVILTHPVYDGLVIVHSTRKNKNKAIKATVLRLPSYRSEELPPGG